MEPSSVQHLSERFTGLSDRFRSQWTFYQFLGGVFKHRDEGPMPYDYDFQGLYRRLQDLVPRMGVAGSSTAALEFEQMDRELRRIHSELSTIESEFPPSHLRRFFDHLKRQDEKILYALTKFYLLSTEFTQDTLDKLDILLTRVAETPLQEGRYALRNPAELRKTFDRLAAFGGIEAIPAAETAPLVDAVREFRNEFRNFTSFEDLVDSRIYDRYRELKQRLGKSFLYPPVLIEVVATNVEAKNQFRRLYREEEIKILEETNQVFEIERYLERNPGLTHDELKRQIEEFRDWWSRFDSGRRDDNIKREDILELRRSMNAVVSEFEPLQQTAEGMVAEPSDGTELAEEPVNVAVDVLAGSEDPFPVTVPVSDDDTDSMSGGTSLTDVLPSDPLLNESLHKMMFALEMVVWDRSPEQAVHSQELHDLRLEPWEVSSYLTLVEKPAEDGSTARELEVFFMRSAALRIKMEAERREIESLSPGESEEKVFELLERSAQSLERAREMEHRFQWFIDDMLYGGETEKLEQLYRSRFRFLHAYSALWLEHQARGGLTPL
jgi:hypothetical protein